MQVTGEAEYTDDTPVPPNTLHAALVLSKMPHARILSIDDSESKSSLGFSGLFLAKDVPADNNIGPVVADEELFATDVVTCVGQVRGDLKLQFSLFFFTIFFKKIRLALAGHWCGCCGYTRKCKSCGRKS